MPQERRGQNYDPSSAPPPPAPDDDDKPSPIGVPDDYPIPGAVPGPGQRPLNPAFTGDKPTPTGRYMEGDEYLPANWNAAQIYMLQQQLVKAGLLNSNFARGVWDPQTMGAYHDLLAIANARGVQADQALAEAVTATEAFGVNEEPRAPLVVQTTDPTVLRQVFRRAVIELTGQGWDRDRINSMVSSYNDLERQRQQQAYDMQVTGGEIAAIPDPESFIEGQLQENYSEDVDSEEALGFANDLMAFASGGGSF